MFFLARLSFVGFGLTELFVLRSMLPSSQRPTITPVQLSYRIDLPPEDLHLARRTLALPRFFPTCPTDECIAARHAACLTPTALLFILALPALHDSQLCERRSTRRLDDPPQTALNTFLLTPCFVIPRVAPVLPR